MRGAAEKAGQREEHDRTDEIALAAEHRPEPARERNDDDAREDVARGDPGDLVETGVWRGGATIFMRAVLKVYDQITLDQLAEVDRSAAVLLSGGQEQLCAADRFSVPAI